MNPDKRVFQLMNQVGGDVKKIRPVHFYFYFIEQHNAIQCSQRLENMNFTVQVSQSGYDSKWLCLATRMMEPDSDIIEGLRTIFEQLSEKFEGNYDGWETELIL